MEDYGLLDKEQKLTPRAVEIYFKHRREILENGKVDLPYACYEAEKDKLASEVDIEDRTKYPSFHENWIDGIYTECARLLNVEGNMSLPIFDILALGGKLDLPQPNLGLPALLAALAIPPPLSIQAALCALNVDIAKLPEFMPKIMELIKPPEIPVPKIPAIPSPAFPDLSYPVTQPIPGLTLKDRQIEIYTALPKALTSLIGEVANPSFIVEFATQGPNVLFKKSCEALNAALPKPDIENRRTYDANIGALVASLSKPLGAVGMGLTFGSASNGITGGMGASEPDQVKNPENKEGATDVLPVPLPTTVSNNYGGFEINTTPLFRQKLVDICKILSAESNGKIQIKPAWLVTIMYNETFGTFLPNYRSGEKYPGKSHGDYVGQDGPAVGLIQFNDLNFVNNGLGTPGKYTKQSVGSMSSVTQLDVVADYYRVVSKAFTKINTLFLAYIAVFSPKLAGKSGDKLINVNLNEKTKEEFGGNKKYIDAEGFINRKLIMSALEKPIVNSNLQIYIDRQETTTPATTGRSNATFVL